MIKRFACMVILTAVFLSARAQKRDTLFVQDSGDGWVINHRVKAGETIFSIARNYHIPPAMLAGANEMNLQQKPAPGSRLEVPLGAYNLKNETGMYTGEMRPIYHRLRAGESLKRMARNSNVTQRRLLEWNNMTAENVYEGAILKVGWILYDVTGTSLPPVKDAAPAENTAAPPVTAAPPAPVPPGRFQPVTDTIRISQPALTDSLAAEKSEAETLYDQQVVNGITTEKGPAAFFNSNNVAASFYYAFHNEAPKGTIIKVRNTNNGKTIFVKVLGVLPNTGLYHNCIIGISSRAKAELGVRDEKAWCELSYGR